MAEQKKSGGTRKSPTTAKKSGTTTKKNSAAPKPAAKAATATKAPGKAAAPRSKKSATKPATAGPAGTSEEMRQRMIREAAYYRALNRGFNGNAEMEDWLIAEHEIDAMLGRLGG